MGLKTFVFVVLFFLFYRKILLRKIKIIYLGDFFTGITPFIGKYFDIILSFSPENFGNATREKWPKEPLNQLYRMITNLRLIPKRKK